MSRQLRKMRIVVSVLESTNNAIGGSQQENLTKSTEDSILIYVRWIRNKIMFEFSLENPEFFFPGSGFLIFYKEFSSTENSE